MQLKGVLLTIVKEKPQDDGSSKNSQKPLSQKREGEKEKQINKTQLTDVSKKASNSHLGKDGEQERTQKDTILGNKTPLQYFQQPNYGIFSQKKQFTSIVFIKGAGYKTVLVEDFLEANNS